MREIARLVVERETQSCHTPETLAAAVEGVFARLEGLMATLIGPMGFRAIVDRAVHMTNSAWPWIDTKRIETTAQLVITGSAAAEPASEAEGIARVQSNVTISGLANAIQSQGAARVTAGAATLLCNVLQLLSSFIGDELTLRIVDRAWPYLSGPPTPSSSEQESQS
jgi:hypothetical protein